MEAEQPTTRQKIEAFLGAKTYAVAGASDDPRKFGHRCYVALARHRTPVYAINPNAATVQGSPAYPDVRSTPTAIDALSVVTPPAATEQIVEDAIAAGVKTVWMQPGAESRSAIRRAEEAGLLVISGGPCLLVELAGQDR